MRLCFLIFFWCFVISLAQRTPIVASLDTEEVAPEIIVNESTSNIRVIAGNTARLPCEAKGVPRPKLTWTRPKGQLLPSGQEKTIVKTLVITKARKEDSGTYICTAFNGVGKDAVQKVNLEVEYPPTIDIPRPRVAQAVGYDAELTCNVQAVPTPMIHWKIGNETIIPCEEKYAVSLFSREETGVLESTLTVKGLSKDQYGPLSCHANNRHGSASGNLELYQSKMPICPPVCGYTDLSSSTSTLSPHSILFSLASYAAVMFRCR